MGVVCDFALPMAVTSPCPWFWSAYGYDFALPRVVLSPSLWPWCAYGCDFFPAYGHVGRCLRQNDSYLHLIEARAFNTESIHACPVLSEDASSMCNVHAECGMRLCLAPGRLHIGVAVAHQLLIVQAV